MRLKEQSIWSKNYYYLSRKSHILIITLSVISHNDYPGPTVLHSYSNGSISVTERHKI